MNEFLNNWKLIIILCLTLGLAPFFPEPHVWGKLKWVAGGAVGMGAMDWFDLLFHGFPFLLLIRKITLSFFKK
jgi:fucose 4-O-acetylase-like acetyltransferase